MKDRKGKTVKVGNIVVQAITVNKDLCFYPFTTTIYKKNGKGRIILDGVYGWQYLSEVNPKTITVFTPEICIRDLAVEYIREFDNGYERPQPRAVLEVLSNICEFLNIKSPYGEAFPVTRTMLREVISKIDTFKKVSAIDKFKNKKKLAKLLTEISKILKEL